MKIITIDFETRYDSDYSLTKLTNSEYITDERFLVKGFGIKFNAEPAVWVPEAKVERTLAALKSTLETNFVLAHNGYFDFGILAFKYGIHPKFMLDTMCMARALGYQRVSLQSLCDFHGLGSKAHLSPTSSPEELALRGAGDCDLEYALFEKLMPGFPPTELQLINLTLRWYTRPTFVADTDALKLLIDKLNNARNALMLRLNLTSEQLQSSDQFKTLLEAQGVEVQMKPGSKLNTKIPCFAKTDEFMKELLDDDNENVANLAAARLGIKSTGELSRAERYLAYASHGPLPVFLSYYGAHPGRWSGGDGTNFQNLKRGAAIRDALRAPAGHTLIVGDLAQIEARLVAWLAKAVKLLDGFRAQQDVYATFASEAFGREVTKANEFERFSGKSTVLGAGYGCGGERAFIQMRAEIRKRGLSITPPTLEVATMLIESYRRQFHQVPELWTELRYKLLLNPGYRVGPIVSEGDKLRLPNGLALHYHDLQRTSDGLEYTGRGNKPVRLWGGKCLQNICEALGRLILAEQMLYMEKGFESQFTGSKIITTTHDEVVVCAPAEYTEGVKDFMQWTMENVAPDWAEGLPLKAEIGSGTTYGSAK